VTPEFVDSLSPGPAPGRSLKPALALPRRPVQFDCYQFHLMQYMQYVGEV